MLDHLLDVDDYLEIPASKISIALRKPIYGVGINDADYVTNPVINGKRRMCHFYRKWLSMLNRCYNEKYLTEKPTYKDCFVCDEWLIFSNFKAWMIKQDWEGKELDKDLLVLGNKVYSPETCLFVSRDLNVLLTDRGASRGVLPIGVSFCKYSGKFRSRFRRYGKIEHLGYYNTPEQAHQTYIEAKEKHVHELALQQEEPLKTALLNWRVQNAK